MRYFLAIILAGILLALYPYSFKEPKSNRISPSQYDYYNKAHQIDTFTLSGGTFDVNVKVVITKNVVFALNVVKDNIDSSYTPKDFDARGVTFYQYGYPIVLWLPEKPVSIEQISVANHELFHVTRAIMLNASTELSDQTEETYAYELQYISKQFYEKVK